MNIPCNQWTGREDFMRSDTFSLDCLDVVDGENEKQDTLSLNLPLRELERVERTSDTDQVEQTDELAETKNDDDADHGSSNNTGVRTVDVSSATVLTPSRLTLYYAKDTPVCLTNHLPNSQTVPAERHVPIGRFKSAQPHIFLNSETMSRFYGEIRMDRNQVFWVKNVSKNKTIKIQFSKGKRRQSQILNFGKEVEIKTNHIVTFHTLEFKVVINRGDCDSVNFEIVVGKEPETPISEHSPCHQVIYNQGQIDRLYMNGESTENNSGVVVNNAQLYRSGLTDAGMASQRRLNGLTDLPLQINGHWAHHVTPGYGTGPLGINRLPQYPAPGMSIENAGTDYNCIQYRPNLLQIQPESAFRPPLGPNPHIVPYSTNLPPQYAPFGYGHQYGFSHFAPSSQQSLDERGFSQAPPPPYFPSPSSNGFNQVSSVDTSRSLLVPSALQEKGPERFYLPHSELLTGTSKTQVLSEAHVEELSEAQVEGEGSDVDQGRSEEFSGEFHPVNR